MRNASQCATWAEARDGATGWRANSLAFVRHAWDLPADESSPQFEWESTPLIARHSDRLPPIGAPCFWKGPSPLGHAAIAVEYRCGTPSVACSDIAKLGRVDVVPLSRIEREWPSATWLGWTSVLQGRRLPLPVPNGVTRNVPSPYRQGGMVYRSHLRFGRRASDSVWNLQRALLRKGYGIGLPVPSGDYLVGTRAAVAAFQRSQGWSGRDADGLASRLTVTRLGLIWVAD